MSRTPKLKLPETFETYPEGFTANPQKETIIEIGPGRGDFLFQLAQENPQVQVIALEIKKKRVAKLIPRIQKLQLNNIAVFLGDGRTILKEKLKGIQASQIYILFSDPWPKKRHIKHRIFQPYFLETLRESLKPHGIVLVSTDAPHYARYIQDLFAADLHWRTLDAKTPPPGVFETFFAEKWKTEGRPLDFFQFQIISS